jgi:hypothetical protein
MRRRCDANAYRLADAMSTTLGDQAGTTNEDHQPDAKKKKRKGAIIPGGPSPWAFLSSSASPKIRVTYIHRRGARRFVNDFALVAALRHYPNTTLRLCCDGLSYSEQLALMRDTDVLIAVHGAGLLHILNVGNRPGPSPDSDDATISNDASPQPNVRWDWPTPLVVHVASRRLNYHEQTVLERLALLSHAVTGVRYMSTRTRTPALDPTAAWQQRFWLPAEEMSQLMEDAIERFVSGV